MGETAGEALQRLHEFGAATSKKKSKFGEPMWFYTIAFGKKVSRAEIAKAEKRLGRSLPAEYVALVTTHGVPRVDYKPPGKGKKPSSGYPHDVVMPPKDIRVLAEMYDEDDLTHVPPKEKVGVRVRMREAITWGQHNSGVRNYFVFDKQGHVHGCSHDSVFRWWPKQITLDEALVGWVNKLIREESEYL
ncbi:MAG TPA: SMI1/KNR4 family protein [Kofleriaceae bacterium]|jgi:hypothetical protein